MKRRFATIYAAACTLGLAAGFLTVFLFAWQEGVDAIINTLAALAASFVLAPIVHELGHISFGCAARMQVMYSKFFCFKIIRKGKKMKLRFTSPFAADETQATPKSGGNMQRRAAWYSLGGLLYSGVFFAIFLAGAIILSCLGYFKGQLWGFVPYFGYLFLLNLAPVEYASGKTDMLVYQGIKKGYDAEKTMLSAMEIQGRLYAGNSFSEIDEKWYFDTPQLCEDEPLYAVMLDLRYRYFLEKEDYEKAADCLNRLAQSQAYLSEREVEKIAAELTYMHALRGDIESAEASGQLCKGYLSSEEASAKRILAAYSKAAGKTEAIEPLLAQAEACLKNEAVSGLQKSERILLSRIYE